MDREFIIKIDSPEWDYMWEELGKQDINKENEYPTLCFHNLEGWEYMDTSWYGITLQHCFRHRCHPKQPDEYTYITIPVSENLDWERDCRMLG